MEEFIKWVVENKALLMIFQMMQQKLLLLVQATTITIF